MKPGLDINSSVKIYICNNLIILIRIYFFLNKIGFCNMLNMTYIVSNTKI